MDLEFSADQEMLRETVRRFLTDKAPITPYVRSMLDDDRGTSDAVWQGLAELGLTGLLVPEAHGGAGMGLVDMGVVLEEMGRLVHPGPFLASAVTATKLLSALGGDELLSSLATGAKTATLALLEPGRRYEWRAPTVVASNGSLSGSKVHVPDGAATDVLLVTAIDGNELAVYAVDRAGTGVAVTSTPTVDGTRKTASVDLQNAPARRIGRGDATAAVATTLDIAGIALAVDGVGAAQAALDMGVEYAKVRKQFDKPIGSFQAVQHLCADMLYDLELGRAAAYYALWAADAGDDAERHRAATMAQAQVSEAFPRLAETAIQVFGGIGFTWEHDIHLFYKRMLSLERAYGGPSEHLEELAKIALG